MKYHIITAGYVPEIYESFNTAEERDAALEEILEQNPNALLQSFDSE